MRTNTRTRIAAVTATAVLTTMAATSSASSKDHYRKSDGVRMGYDPADPALAAKYGAEGDTDPEGFDPHADSVGAGIYGGSVRRDPATGAVVIGRQYQGHNPRPGPVYDRQGYAQVIRALHRGNAALAAYLDAHPGAATEVTTGGAQPLHMCGMSRPAQHLVPLLVERGADVDALDTYGYTPMHRMASNNLAAGAAALIEAGAQWDLRSPVTGETPLDVARHSAARDVLKLLRKEARGGL